MGSQRTNCVGVYNNKIQTLSCSFCMVFIIFTHLVIRVNSSALLKVEEDPSNGSVDLSQSQLNSNDQFTTENYDNVIKNFTIISPLPPDKRRPHFGKTKRRRIVRRRKRPRVPFSSNNSVSFVTPIISSSATTAEENPTEDSLLTITTPVPDQAVTLDLENNIHHQLSSQDDSHDNSHRATTNVKSQLKKRGHVHKVPEVWKIPELDEKNEVLELSLVGKRDSMESSNSTTGNVTSSGENSKNRNNQDLHTEESNHPFSNSSTPISSELQNSLQFNLKILHPLLNSDSVLSDKSPKVPEDKTVELTHTLSDSFAQTPVAPDLGFLPTHLKKKHPLLNQDSIFTGENGASKTGIRINDDQYPAIFKTQPTTTTTTSTTTTSTTTKPVVETTTSISTTQRPSSTTSRTSIVTFPRIITSVTTTEVGSTSPTTRYTTTPSTTTTTTAGSSDSQESKVLGILNITELNGQSSSEENNPFPTSYERPTINTNYGFPSISDENDEIRESPEVVIFPGQGQNQVTTATSPSSSTTIVPPFSVIPPNSNENSAEVSSAEQMLVEQLLGIGSQINNPSNSSSDQVDSSEQLVNLFNNLVNTQVQQGAGGNGNANHDANVLLQSILANSLKPQNSNEQQNFGNNALLNLGSLLTSSTTAFSTPPPPPPPPPKIVTTTTTTTTTHKPIQLTEGLSDYDLKSIFALLDSQTPLSNPTTVATVPSTEATTPSTTTTPTTTTTIPTTMRTTTTYRTPTVLTTTLHPALQSMLDLFNNQLKPFQSIPSSSPTFLQDLSPLRTTTLPPTTTPTTTRAPVTTVNSLDILSQLLNFGNGNNKINPVRATPAPAPTSELSLASIFGGQQFGNIQPTPIQNQNSQQQFSLANIFGKNNNIFPSNFPAPAPVGGRDTAAPSESNQLLNFFGTQQTTQPPPNGLYYWLDLNAFLGGDPKANPTAGIRPKMGNKYPFIKINR